MHCCLKAYIIPDWLCVVDSEVLRCHSVCFTRAKPSGHSARALDVSLSHKQGARSRGALSMIDSIDKIVSSPL